MNMKNVTDALYRFRKLIATVIMVTGFFSFYNIFLVDYTLENLKFSLEQTALAYDVKDTNGLDMVMSKVIAKEIPPVGMNTKNTAHLEYVRNIVLTGSNFRQLEYMRIALKAVIRQKEKDRGIFLTLLDRLNWPIRNGLIQLAYLPNYIFRPKLAEAQTNVAEVNLFEKIRVLEREKDPRALVADYKEIIAKYPTHEDMGLIKLRLAYAYQRLGDYDTSIKLYKEIVKRYSPQKEARIAQIFLTTLRNKDKMLKRANSLIVQSRTIAAPEIEAKQEMFYEVGTIYAQLLSLDDAIRFFDRVISLNASNDIAIKARFNVAWLNKQRNDFEKSLTEFTRILLDKLSSDIVFDCRYQLADIYHYQGKYEESIDLLTKMADEYKEDSDIASLCLFQVGASYMYDLNDTEKAEETFKTLSKEYRNTAYGELVSPRSARGLFITYVVPRATRLVAWRMMGLLCLSGYSGEIVKFQSITTESGFNLGFTNWLKSEVPDTLGNLYIDIRGQETKFNPGKATTRGRITMGKYNVEGEADWGLDITKGSMLAPIIKRAILEKMPIAPILLNKAIAGLIRVTEKNTPIQVTKTVISKDGIVVDGFGSKDMIERIKKDSLKLFMTNLTIEGFKNPEEEKDIYASFREKFPEGEFGPTVEYNEEKLVVDFFTRMSLYVSFKLLETVKDSKLDYQRSIRTLGALAVKKENFLVDFQQDHLNAELGRYIKYEFPWVVNDKFSIDIKGLELHFKEGGIINFDTYLSLGYGGSSLKPNDIKVNGSMTFEIDKESGIPRMVFKEVSLNGAQMPVEKLNMISLRCLNILKDEHLPLTVENIRTYDGGIVFKGRGAGDFIARLFYDPHPFVIFQIRKGDLALAGVKRMKTRIVGSETFETYYKGRQEKEGGFGAVQQYEPEKGYKE